jgi:hypothetical protein
MRASWAVNHCCRYATVGAVVDPVTNEKQEKAVFVVFFAGERARVKILKVGLGVSLLPPCSPAAVGHII